MIKQYVTLLKKDPLTASEVNQYSDGYVSQDGEYPYFESDTCNENNQTGCSTNYDTSDVKKIVDGWSSSFSNDLVSVDGYKSRLLTIDELIDKFGYEKHFDSGIHSIPLEDSAPDWLYNYYNYWTMSGVEDSKTNVYTMSTDSISSSYIVAESSAVRLVINLKKCAFDNTCE